METEFLESLAGDIKEYVDSLASEIRSRDEKIEKLELVIRQYRRDLFFQHEEDCWSKEKHTSRSVLSLMATSRIVVLKHLMCCKDCERELPNYILDLKSDGLTVDYETVKGRMP